MDTSAVLTHTHLNDNNFYCYSVTKLNDYHKFNKINYYSLKVYVFITSIYALCIKNFELVRVSGPETPPLFPYEPIRSEALWCVIVAEELRFPDTSDRLRKSTRSDCQVRVHLIRTCIYPYILTSYGSFYTIYRV